MIFVDGIKRVSMGLSVWRETSKKFNRVSWKREKINRVSWIIFVQITVLFVEGLNGVKRVAWNIQKINRVPCLLHPHWDPVLITKQTPEACREFTEHGSVGIRACNLGFVEYYPKFLQNVFFHRKNSAKKS